MSSLTERVNKPYPEDMIEPKDLPDQAPAEHPIPWTIHSGGNGHVYVFDANTVQVAHVYCYECSEIDQLETKLTSINGACANVLERL